jgi:hypothetical protein
MKPVIFDPEFEKAAKEMIEQKRHADYMKSALKRYKAYQIFMADAFLDEADDAIYIIRAKYRLKPHVWREFECHGRNMLADLATSIIESMGWGEDHLHGFWFPDERRNRIFSEYGIFHEEMEDDPFTMLKTQEIPVSQVDWNKYPVLGFMFDFGDGHEFDILLKNRRDARPNEKRKAFPRLTDLRGVAPEQYPSYEEELRATMSRHK